MGNVTSSAWAGRQAHSKEDIRLKHVRMMWGSWRCRQTGKAALGIKEVSTGSQFCSFDNEYIQCVHIKMKDNKLILVSKQTTAERRQSWIITKETEKADDIPAAEE